MSGTFRNDISTTGFITSKKTGPLIGSVLALPTPSEEYEGKTLQYIGEDVGLTLRKSNMYICVKQADGTYIWKDNSPAGGGVWGKIIGNPNDQGDLVTRIQSIINDSKTSTDFTWSAENLLARFNGLAGVTRVVVVETLPATLTINTIYYVGTEPNFNIKLYANNGAEVPTLYDLGSTTISFSDYYNKGEIDGKFTVVNDTIRLVDENKAGKTGYTADKVLVTTATGAMTTSTATSTELGYLEGATSNIQVQIGNKQNTVTYGTEEPSPTAGAVGDLYIKDATDGVWSRVNPETIIDDSTLSGSKTFSSNLLNNKWNQMDAAKQNRVLTGTTDPSPTAGVFGDIYIKYGEEDTWSKVEVNNIIKDGVTATTSTWSSSELKARFQALAGGARVEMVTTKPETGVLNTTYYVGTASPYHIWLYANNSSGVATWFDLGVTSIDFSDYYKKTEADAKFLSRTECTVPVGGIFETLDSTIVPGTKWTGTTWEALPDYKEWDEVSETVLTNPAGVEGVVAYSVHCNVVTVKFDFVKCAEPVHNYFYRIPTKYNPNANQLCVVLNAWDDDTTKTFACVTTTLPDYGNIYLRRISNTENTQYGFISFPCGGGTPDRTYKRYKRTA